MSESKKRGQVGNVVISGPNPADDPNAQAVQELGTLEGMSDKEFEALAAQVMVVIPYRQSEGISPGICNHFGMWGRMGIRMATINDPFGGFIECTRGGMVKMFLEYCETHSEVRYLVMIDSDQSITWDTPMRLALHGLPIVSGIVCNYSPERGLFACFSAYDENGVARFPSQKDTKMFPARGVKSVKHVGTGLVCIRRDVLETLNENDEEAFFIPEAYRRDSVRDGQLRKGEDMAFCDRAHKYGFERYVDFSIHAGHHKNIQLGWPESQIDPDLDVDDWHPSTFDYRGVV